MKYTYFIIPLIAIIIIIYYSQSVENFQVNTFETLFNLPSWVVYSILFLFVIAMFFSQIYPWIAGLSSVNKGITAASNFGSKWLNAKYGRTTTVNTSYKNNSYKNNS